MRTLSRILAGILLLAAPAAFAQSSATASATVKINKAILLTKTTDMNFGDVYASDLAAGTVVLSTADTATPTGVLLGTTTPTSAAFTVSGANNKTYAITLPGSVTLSDGATHTMTVDTFTSNPNGTGTLSATGGQTLKVGATLHVGQSQAEGTYTATAPFTVTVGYN
jgi:hypothetical protein